MRIVSVRRCMRPRRATAGWAIVCRLLMVRRGGRGRLLCSKQLLQASSLISGLLKLALERAELATVLEGLVVFVVRVVEYTRLAGGTRSGLVRETRVVAAIVGLT